MARVMACRIHHVAYVENLNPRRQSNSSTARISPMLPSWTKSRKGRPWPWYFRAMDTTKRRLARMNRCRASRPLRTASLALRMDVSDLSRPPASLASASSPCSMAMASSTSSSLVRRGSRAAASR